MDRQALCQEVAARLGKDPAEVDADFDRMESDIVSFDDPESWPFLEATVMAYEEIVVQLETEDRAQRTERIARQLGVPIEESADRIEEIEAALGRSLDDPAHLAQISVALMLYRLHEENLPPPGHPSWLDPGGRPGRR